MTTLHAPEIHPIRDPAGSEDPAKIGICVTFHGKQRKSGGNLAAEAQAFMLGTSVRRLISEERFPVILSGVLANPLNYPVGKARDTALQLWKEHYWISTTEEYDHQLGALQTIFNGLQCALALGLEWLLVTAEDVLFDSTNPVRETYEMAKAAGVDYLGRPWLDDIGIEAISTQVFICRVRALMDPERDWYPWRREYFNGYRGIEHYTVQTLINHRVPYLRTTELDYFHTHSPDEYKEHLSSLEADAIENPHPRPKRRRRVLLRFGHGLGDAIQLTAVLRHLRELKPELELAVAALRGKHTAMYGMAERVFVLGEEGDEYDEIINLEWPENWLRERDAPNTKAALCLRQVFGLHSRMELLKYHVPVLDECTQKARRYMEEIGAPLEGDRYRAVALHYQGNTSQANKNLEHRPIAEVCESLLKHRYVPIILDWDRRSPLPDSCQVFCPDVDHWLWENTGTGDAAQIAALLNVCSAFVGIDSGPLHVAAALETKGLGVWTGHMPIRYIEPSENLLHLVPAIWRTVSPCDDPAVARNQETWYRLAEYQSTECAAEITRHLQEHCGLQLGDVEVHPTEPAEELATI